MMNLGCFNKFWQFWTPFKHQQFSYPLYLPQAVFANMLIIKGAYIEGPEYVDY